MSRRLSEDYMLNSAPARVIYAVIGWPFEMPTRWRRLSLLAFPITMPIWLAGSALIAAPLMFWVMFRMMVDDIWHGIR